MKLRCILTCFVLIYGHYLVDTKYTKLPSYQIDTAGLTNFLPPEMDPCLFLETRDFLRSKTNVELSRLTQILNNVFNQRGIKAVSN